MVRRDGRPLLTWCLENVREDHDKIFQYFSPAEVKTVDTESHNDYYLPEGPYERAIERIASHNVRNLILGTLALNSADYAETITGITHG